MKQEDYNEMMITPAEAWRYRQSNAPSSLPLCPTCKEEYLGNGVAECVECESKKLAEVSEK